MSVLFLSFLSLLHTLPLDFPEADEYAVEGKTDALLLRPSDGFPLCCHGC